VKHGRRSLVGSFTSKTPRWRQPSHRRSYWPTTAPHRHRRRGYMTTSLGDDTGGGIVLVRRVFLIDRSGRGLTAVMAPLITPCFCLAAADRDCLGGCRAGYADRGRGGGLGGGSMPRGGGTAVGSSTEAVFGEPEGRPLVFTHKACPFQM